MQIYRDVYGNRNIEGYILKKKIKTFLYLLEVLNYLKHYHFEVHGNAERKQICRNKIQIHV